MRRARLAVLAIALAACNSDAPIPAVETATFAPSLGVDLNASTKTASGLYYRDLAVGGGAVVANGQHLSMHYTGYLTNGTVFDANTTGNPPFVFILGAGQVIAGWDEGVAGMKVGGRRQLILPPSLGYGAGGSGPIPPNAILVFTVEVVAAS